MRLIYVVNLGLIGVGFWVILNFDKEVNYGTTMNWLYVLSVLEGIHYVDFVVRSNFNNLICDNRLSCTYLAVMNSMNNFARMSITPIFTLLLGWFDFKSLGIFFFSFAVFYVAFIYKKFVYYFDTIKKKDFMLQIGSTQSSKSPEAETKKNK